jgi:hypothetical protein
MNPHAILRPLLRACKSDGVPVVGGAPVGKLADALTYALANTPANASLEIASPNTTLNTSQEGKTTKKKALGMCLAALVAFLMGLTGLVGFAGEADSATSCVGKQVSSSQNLAQVAADSPAGTTFCLEQGTYDVSSPVRVQSNDKFIGVYSEMPRPKVITDTAPSVFDANGSDGARIEGLRVEGAVGEKTCQPFCGRGISGGTNLTIVDVRATNNDNQGVGGTGDGLLVDRSVVDHNGSAPFAKQDGGESAAGIKSVNSLRIVNSYIYDNYWAGVWCDLQCGRFEVHDSTLLDNGRAAIHDEVSTGPALFEGNRIQGNGGASYTWGHHGGLLIVSSTNVEAYGNTFGNNDNYGIDIVEDSRSPVTSNVSTHDNTMNGDRLAGCGLRGVSCTNN